jgi:hypothetical protein
MNARNLVYSDRAPHRAFSLFLFCAWAVLVFVLAWNHVVWRDEAKAYTFAMQGHSLLAMWRGLRGDGHPMLWHLLIRAGHVLYPHPPVIQVVAFLIAFASIFLLALRSPFSPFALVLLLFSRFALYEYSVMARNYGISMLLLFLLAVAYPRRRERGLLIGVLLFLLANCNVPSVMLVGAFLVFWLLDLLWNAPGSRSLALRNYALNAVIAVLGIALCAVTIYPPIDDAAPIALPHGIAFLAYLCKSFLEPAEFFSHLLLFDFLRWVMALCSFALQPHLRAFKALMSLLLFASTLGLVRRPAALLASWLALFGFTFMFAVLYPGFDRHEDLWLIFLIAMYWIAHRNSPAAAKKDSPAIRAIQSSGYIAFMLLLALQTVAGVLAVKPLLRHVAPESRARDLGQLISSDPGLHTAIIMADPDYLVETLPYYASNPTYILREHRFGNIVHFTHNATLNLSLDDILATARQLRADTGRPVIILLQDRLNPSAPPQVKLEGYDWQLSTTPGQVRRFLDSTRLLKSFGPVYDNDETFDVYLLN